MILFLVVEHGVYRQRILGCYAALIEAEALAKATAEKENDGYHEYIVYSLPVGEPLEVEGQDLPIIMVYTRDWFTRVLGKPPSPVVKLAARRK